MLSAIKRRWHAAYLRLCIRWVEFDITCMQEAQAVLPAEIRSHKLHAIGLREKLAEMEATHG